MKYLLIVMIFISNLMSDITLNDKLIMSLYSKALENDIKAQYNLSLLYLYNPRKSEKDISNAIYWLKKASTKNENAKILLNQLNTAKNDIYSEWIYHIKPIKYDDNITKIDLLFQSLIKNQKDAILECNSTAAYNIGVTFYENLSIQQNLHESLKWFEKVLDNTKFEKKENCK